MRSHLPWGRVFLSFLLCSCTLFTPSTSALAVGPTLIGEVQWSGSSHSTADEWLELWNMSPNPVSLEGWRLVGASVNPVYFVDGQVIQPYSVFLIANYSNDSDKTLLTHPVDLATSTLALANDQLFLQLYDATGTLQDSAGDGSKPLAGMSSPTNTSMIRVLTSTTTNWQAATTTFNVLGPDLGTPGICDQCQTIVPASTFVEPVSSLVAKSTSTHSAAEVIEDIESAIPSATNTTEIVDLIDETITHEESGSEAASSTSENASSTSPISDVPSSETVVPEAPTDSLNQSTTTPETPPVTPVIQAPTNSGQSAATVPDTTQTHIPDLVITEFMAAPSTGGEEWIELAISRDVSPSHYADWKIYQDGKVIFTLTNTVLREMNLSATYLLPSWKTSKLKNTGGVLQLRRADETLVQEISYGKSTHNMSWIQATSTNVWVMTLTPTKGAENLFTSLVVETPEPKAVVPSVTVAKPAVPQTTTVPSIKVSGTKSSSAIPTSIAPSKNSATASDVVLATKTLTSTKVISATAKTTKPKATAPKVAAKKTTTTKKTSTAKPVAAPILMSIDTLSSEQIEPKVRVRLQGIVGSAPGVFGKQLFVLLGHDGRGLLVKGTTHQPSPSLGQSIEVTGLLSANDNGIQLQMASTDVWTAYASPLSASTRIVDWNAPGIEDQWSLTRIEGLATDTRAQSITLETEMGAVVIPMKNALGYRAGRIETGDKIEVTGIFDGRSGAWKVQPGKASDIVIMQPAKQVEKVGAVANSPKAGNQSLWGSIGVGLGSIGAIEGIRRWLAKRRATDASTKTLKPSTV